jgi:hypothetical protein
VNAQAPRAAHRRAGRAVFGVMAAGLAGAGANPCAASEWTFTPQASFNSEVNDNRRLATGSAPTVFGQIATVGTDLVYRTERLAFALAPRGRITRYSGPDDLDSEDVIVDLHSDYRAERWQWAFDADYTRDTTLNSEVEEFGLVQVRRLREEVSATPSLLLQINERTSVAFQGAYTTVVFDQGLQVALVDYDFAALDAVLSRQLDETSDLSLRAGRSRFEAPDVDSRTDNYSVELSYRRRFMERIDASASVGVGVSEIDFLDLAGPTTRDDTHLLLRLALGREFERLNVSAAYDRAVSPSIRGSQTTSDSLSLRTEYRLSERLTAGIDAYYLTTEAQSEIASPLIDRDFVRARGELSYRLNRWWSIAGRYTYTYQSIAAAPASADSNAVMLTLSYQGKPAPLRW